MVRSGAGVACGGHRKMEEKLKELGQSAPVEVREAKRTAADAKNSDGDRASRTDPHVTETGTKPQLKVRSPALGLKHTTLTSLSFLFLRGTLSDCGSSCSPDRCSPQRRKKPPQRAPSGDLRHQELTEDSKKTLLYKLAMTTNPSLGKCSRPLQIIPQNSGLLGVFIL